MSDVTYQVNHPPTWYMHMYLPFTGVKILCVQMKRHAMHIYTNHNTYEDMPSTRSQPGAAE